MQGLGEVLTGTVIISLVGLAWWLRGKFDNLDNSISVYASSMVSMNLTTLNILRIMETDEKLKASEPILKQIVMDISKAEQIDKTLKNLKSFNPLDEEEANKITHYIEKVRKGEKFTSQEAEEFNELAKRLKEEKPKDSGAILIAGIAGLILGLWLASSKK